MKRVARVYLDRRFSEAVYVARDGIGNVEYVGVLFPGGSDRYVGQWIEVWMHGKSLGKVNTIGEWMEIHPENKILNR